MLMRWRTLRHFLMVVGTLTATAMAEPVLAAGCLGNAALKGVNLAGAEFNGKRLPGVLNKDYVYPDKAAFDHFAALGMNTVRLPFRWERLQPALFGELDAAELAQMSAAVAAAKANGMCIILDLHNYGMYHGDPIGSESVPVTAFVDVWQRLASRFSDADVVALGLMNEPFKLPVEQWAAMAQLTVNAIRKADAKHLLLVSGGRWSGVHDWFKTSGVTSNAMAFAGFQDSLKRTVIEVHQYADRNHSGTGKACIPPSDLTSMFDVVSQWAKVNGQKLFLGEFGTPADPGCLQALDAMLTKMDASPVWRGWTYWAAGKWWGAYPLSIEPRNGQDAAQTTVLKKFL
ncbi:MAG: glycoside hydrolase family 5 protein [Thiobacillus sp.]|nr:glycoside hydrolase family 5 protein [Thiobacillus sp.]